MLLNVPLYDGQGYVKVLDVIPSKVPDGFSSRDAVISQAASYSTNRKITDNIKAYDLLQKLFAWKHFSPFEQARISFEVKAPTVVFWQLDRHRTFQYSSHLRRSARYTEYTEEDFYIPHSFDQHSLTELEDINDPGTTFPLFASSELKRVIADGLASYRDALASGLKKEHARYFLPAWCMLYTEIMNVDLKNLMHFFALRQHTAAQREIRELADGMFEVTRSLFPYTLKLFEENREPINYNFEGF